MMLWLDQLHAQATSCCVNKCVSRLCFGASWWIITTVVNKKSFSKVCIDVLAWLRLLRLGLGCSWLGLGERLLLGERANRSQLTKHFAELFHTAYHVISVHCTLLPMRETARRMNDTKPMVHER